MLHDLAKPFTDAASNGFGPALIERFTLWINHLLASEPLAMQRLKAQAGRTIRLDLRDPPALLPRPPELVFCITPAGLLEWIGASQGLPAADLLIRVDASNPARMVLGWLGGHPPVPDIEGDSALAADIHWLAENLRWDVADDLERVVGPVAAREIARLGAAVAVAARRAAGVVQGWMPKGSGGPSPR